MKRTPLAAVSAPRACAPLAFEYSTSREVECASSGNEKAGTVQTGSFLLNTLALSRSASHQSHKQRDSNTANSRPTLTLAW